MTTLRIMSFNIYGGRRGDTGEQDLPGQAAFIKALRPDIAMLTEVHNATRVSIGVDQAAYLSEQTGLQYAWGKAASTSGGSIGNAILSRYPLSDKAVKVGPRPGSWWDPAHWRAGDVSTLSVSTSIDGAPYRLMCTHLHSGWPAYRDNQAAALADEVSKLAPQICPILGGDFNEGSEDPNLASLRLSMSEAYVLAHPDQNAPELDQIWVSTRIRFDVASYDVVPTNAVSDHPSAVLAVLVRRPVMQAPALRARPRPFPLPLPSTGPSGVTTSTVQAAVIAVDAATGTAVAGTARLDARNIGGQNVTCATGQTANIGYRRTVTFDPDTHKREISFELPNGIVSAAGYPDAVVDWGPV